MKVIGDALVALRNETTALAQVGPQGVRPIWKLATDASAETAAWPVCILTVNVGASDTNANVPCDVTEEIRFSESAQIPADLADLFLDALNGRLYVGDRVTVAHVGRGRVTTEGGAGVRQTIKIEWRVRASWRPA